MLRYGFLNRLLIPVGLLCLNSVFWFNVAGINDIGRFLGDPTLAYAADLPAAVQGAYHVGMYQAGFFPIMMFGLLGLVLPLFKLLNLKARNKILSIMIAAGFTSFLTGVTEPAFAFMFVAPVLYIIHALLTGLSLFIAASFNWMTGFSFSGGFIDFFLSLRNPMQLNLSC